MHADLVLQAARQDFTLGLHSLFYATFIQQFLPTMTLVPLHVLDGRNQV